MPDSQDQRPFSPAIFWFKSHSMHLLSLQGDCHPWDPDARWLSTFPVSQVHRSLPPVVSGCRLGGDVDVNFPDDRSLQFLSLAPPTVPLPGWAKLLHLNPTNYQQVPSAAQRERVKLRIRKCKCSTILSCYAVLFPTAAGAPAWCGMPLSSFLW